MNPLDNTERAVIAAMMGDVQCAERGLASLRVEDFADLLCKRVFTTMKRLHDGGGACDLVRISEHFNANEYAELVALSTAEYFSCSMSAYITDLRDASLSRFILREVDGLKNSDAENGAELLERLHGVCDKAASLGSSTVPRASEFSDESLAALGETVRGVPSGFAFLDHYAGGLVRGSLYLVAGRPSMGKSTLAMNIVRNVCEKGYSTAVFSLEDSKHAFVQRMLSADSMRSLSDVKCGIPEAVASFAESNERVKGWNLFVDDGGSQSAASIAEKCYSVKQQCGALDCVVVDYIGLIQTRQGKNTTRQQELAEASHSFKRLAKDLDCAVILLSQLNRSVETRNDNEPRMSDLRECGDLEQDADVILFPFRPAVYDKTESKYSAKLIIAKNRNGQTGTRDLAWRGECFRFMEMAKQ